MQEYHVLLCNSQDKKEKLDKPKGKRKGKDIGSSKEARFQLPSCFMMEGQMRCHLLQVPRTSPALTPGAWVVLFTVESIL